MLAARMPPAKTVAVITASDRISTLVVLSPTSASITPADCRIAAICNNSVSIRMKTAERTISGCSRSPASIPNR
jgi:hypothetical protein